MQWEDYLAVPYVMTVQAVAGQDGDWVYRAEMPELPGCSVDSPSVVEAVDELERLRVRCILGLLERGEPVPVPRPPLRSVIVSLSAAEDPRYRRQIRFTRWLVEQGRLSG